MSVAPNIAEFVREHMSAARAIERDTGLLAEFILCHSGLESGWGAHAPGFNFFGVKAGPSWKGPRQLRATWEASKDGKLKLQPGEELIRTYKPGETGNPFGDRAWAHRIRAYFRAYSTALVSFGDYAKLLQREHYARSWALRTDFDKLAVQIIKDGYGTDPDYPDKLKRVRAGVREAMGLTARTGGSGSSAGAVIVTLAVTALLAWGGYHVYTRSKNTAA